MGVQNVIVHVHAKRLLREADAADYLSIGATTFRGLGIKSRRVGRCVLYDVKDLDRWADRMEDQPVADADRLKESISEEERFFERRQARGRN